MPRKSSYLIFCAQDQKPTEWNHLPDRNGEILFQCTECGRFLKYPTGTTRSKLAKLFIEQEKQNAGAVPVETVPSPVVVSQQEPKPIKESFWEKMKDAFYNNSTS